MRDVSGVTGAAPVWMEMVNYLHRRKASIAPGAPDGVVRMEVRYDRDVEPARIEVFLAGTETARIAAKAVAAIHAGIAYPGNGTIIALDPDIPESVQRVRFMVSPQVAGYRWHLDDEEIGVSDQPIFWVPRPGSHELSIVDQSGTAVDRVRFEVRGSIRQSQVQ
jgi:penicillin-binding protein 1C